MGAIYTGYAGLGFKIEKPDKIKNEGYYIFTVGEESYICLDEPFKDGWNITDKVENLVKYLKQNNITYYGDFGIVGAVEIEE